MKKALKEKYRKKYLAAIEELDEAIKLTRRAIRWLKTKHDPNNELTAIVGQFPLLNKEGYLVQLEQTQKDYHEQLKKL